MSGELSLTKLLCTLKPTLDPRTFVFITLSPEQQQQQPLAIPFADMQMTFRENEGLTIITTLKVADKYNAAYFFKCNMVTLGVHSSLEAVGLTKMVSGRMADEGISANIVSAYFHDHIFVEEGVGERVLEILESVAEEARREAGVLS